MAALESGKSDACAGDRLVPIDRVTKSKDPGRYVMLNEMFSGDPYGFALFAVDLHAHLTPARSIQFIEHYRLVLSQYQFASGKHDNL
jgi:hypothetical protein